MTHHTVLIADDEEVLRTNFTKVLTDAGFDVIPCADAQAALVALKSSTVDAIITGLRARGTNGMDLVDHARELAPDAGIVDLTAIAEAKPSVNAMKDGVREYVGKPVDLDDLVSRLKRLLAHGELVKQNRILRAQLKRSCTCEDLVAHSPAMISIVEAVKRIAQTTSNVLICGEGGTGKNVLARALHYSGVTKDRPFVPVTCGALVESLAEGGLFGYRRGAFAGADMDHTGYLEAAEGGTLFLDEVGDLPSSSQATLLGAIEEQAYTRIGDTRPRSFNIRIVATTSRDIEKAVEADEFRKDLYHRLDVIRITVPPLCERPEDIRALIDHFVRKYNRKLKWACPGFEGQAVEAMCRRRWRGNTRELENMVERAMILAGPRRVMRWDLPPELEMDGTKAVPVVAMNLRKAMREFQRQHIANVLERFGNDKLATAQAMGIGVSSLYRKIEDLQIPRSMTAPVASA